MKCVTCKGKGILKNLLKKCPTCRGSGKLCNICRQAADYWRVNKDNEKKLDFTYCSTHRHMNYDKYHDERGEPR